MGQHNDSISQKIPKNVHDAMNRITFAIMDILKEAGLQLDFPIDRNPSTGEVTMTEKTKRGLASFKRELQTHKITIDKLGYTPRSLASSAEAAKMADATGYYVMQGREISPGGVVISEGKCLGFVPGEMVEGEVSYADGKETAAGVMV